MQIERTVSLIVTNKVVRMTGTVAIGGEVRRPGVIVEASLNEANDLIRRGKAVPATEAEVESAETIVATGTIDQPAGPDGLAWRAAATWGR
ncbi:hypothetical protein LJR143_001866 [Pseudoxanthomonas sp. LjRoot143]|uniref:hypothetical protein n=1 Tax=Pseudoxanthomonas sp. LjRoot143 TaxID=3342266 RepID=UPI003ECF8BCD